MKNRHNKKPENGAINTIFRLFLPNKKWNHEVKRLNRKTGQCILPSPHFLHPQTPKTDAATGTQSASASNRGLINRFPTNDISISYQSTTQYPLNPQKLSAKKPLRSCAVVSTK